MKNTCKGGLGSSPGHDNIVLYIIKQFMFRSRHIRVRVGLLGRVRRLNLLETVAGFKCLHLDHIRNSSLVFNQGLEFQSTRDDLFTDYFYTRRPSSLLVFKHLLAWNVCEVWTTRQIFAYIPGEVYNKRRVELPE